MQPLTGSRASGDGTTGCSDWSQGLGRRHHWVQSVTGPRASGSPSTEPHGCFTVLGKFCMLPDNISLRGSPPKYSTHDSQEEKLRLGCYSHRPFPAVCTGPTPASAVKSDSPGARGFPLPTPPMEGGTDITGAPQPTSPAMCTHWTLHSLSLAWILGRDTPPVPFS